MRKSLLVLLLAVLLPSMVLGWLALRGAEEQQIVLEKRTAELLQTEVDSVASAARVLLDDQRRDFEAAVRRILSGSARPESLAPGFPAALATEWPIKAIGFVAHQDGRLLAPTARDADDKPELKQFLWENGAFLGNKLVTTVYPVPVEDLNRPDALRKSKENAYSQQRAIGKGQSYKAEQAQQFQQQVASAKVDLEKQSATPAEGVLVLRDATSENVLQNLTRNVAPQKNSGDAGLASQLNWATANFQQVTAGESSGIINRFVQDRLTMVFWLRPENAGGLVFGCLVEAKDLGELWKEATAATSSAQRSPSAGRPQYILALLDDKGQPAAKAPADGVIRELRRPFVASEVGEALPHWEAALYLANPGELQQSARGIRRNLYLLIAAALLAIGVGGMVVMADTRRQLQLAQKKTDFVSNVSHELKTPLTSIRMFAELMSGGAVAEEKRSQYLRIIMLESERLTRLINNVLDFARLERKQKRLDLKAQDLCPVIARVWESNEIHLKDDEFTTRWDAAPGPYQAVADADAVAQILVNLLSNAKKYSPEAKEVILQTFTDQERLHLSVLDRGTGVPRGEEKKIFEAFYRAHDSLASGIQGSGLGLTLANRLAAEQGGSIQYQPREGGGSIFTFTLPLVRSTPVHT